MIQLLLTVYSGFTHAFEADHLLAVSSIVTTRRRLGAAVRDGFFWGLGHTSTIVVVGLLMLFFKVSIGPVVFSYFEAVVGVMLCVLGIYRLVRFFTRREYQTARPNNTQPHAHTLAYSVGLVHGLAGSGALMVLVMTQVENPGDGLLYLLIYGIGSIVGMLVAAGLFSLPYARRVMRAPALQAVLTVASCVLCLAFGAYIVYENLFLA